MKNFFFILFIICNSMLAQKNTNLYDFEREGKSGKVNSLGEIVVPAIYENFGDRKNGLIPAKLNDKYGIIDEKNNIVIPFEYNYISTIKNGLIKADKDEKEGWINTKNQIVVPAIYYTSCLLNDGNFIVKRDDKCAMIDKKGNILLDFKYEDIGDCLYETGYSQNKLLFYENKKYGFLDKKQNVIIEPKFDYANSFIKNNKAVVKFGEKWGIINAKGEFEIPAEFDDIFYYEDLYKIEKDGKEGLLDINLKTIVKPEYDEIYNFYDGYAVIRKDKKYGLINKKGEIIVPLLYDGMNEYGSGLIPVLKENKWGYIDRNNKIVIDFQFTGNVSAFEKDYAVYYKRNFSSMGKYTSEICGIINKKGEIVINPKYESISSDFSDGVTVVTIKNRLYLMDINEKIIFDLREPELVPVGM